MAVAPAASPTHPPTDPAAPLIAGQYAVDWTRPLPGAGGGLASFAVTDRPTLMALQVEHHLPARLRPLQMLTSPLEGVLCPLAHGVGAAGHGITGYFVICSAPPGAPVAVDPRPWREAELLDLVLRPAAQALEALHAIGIPHRAIRPDNLFQAGPGQPVVLGAAWAAPPAALQPALYEPPYSAMCLPAGRGEGVPGDDIYALGVLLLTLALGRPPLAGQDDAAILRRKLDVGSHAALTGEERLPPLIADLVRGMLAEDPEHRPSASLLRDPPAARTRRVAARPSRRAQRPLQVGGATIWSARQAAHLLATNPAETVPALRVGIIDHWLRHGLGDAALAGRLEEMVRNRAADASPLDPAADALLAMRGVALLDPLAPLCWQGIALWPDGIGPALAASMRVGGEENRAADRLTGLIAAEAVGAWAMMRQDRQDAGIMRLEGRQMRAAQMHADKMHADQGLAGNRLAGKGLAGQGGGMARLRYQLNPLLPCASPLLAGRFVARLADLLPALDAADGVDPAKTRPIDAEIAAFIAARSERRLEAEIAALTDSDQDVAGSLAQLRLFAQLQNRVFPRPLPGLAAWLAARSGALDQVWYNRARRGSVQERMNQLAAAGLIGQMLALIEDPAMREADRQEARDAIDAVARIDATLRQLRDGGAERAELAHRLGQEIVACVGVAVLAAVLTTAALG